MSVTAGSQDVCSMCEAQPEDMLILSCRHNLCLDCATEVYNINTKTDSIQCEICLSQTSLDSDTIVCLRSLSARTIQEKGRANKANDARGDLTEQYYPPIPKSHFQHRSSNSRRNMQLPLIVEQQVFPRCQKHNQPLTYYCLECNVYKICSQCMLLQNHRYHKVVTLKKASSYIRETIEKIGREKLKLKNLLEKDKETLYLRKEESERQLETNLLELKEAFDEIIAGVTKKYEQIKLSMENEATRKLEIMEGATNQIQQKIALIEETIKFQNKLIEASVNNQQSQSQFHMFEYYTSQMTQNKVDFQPSLPNFISEVNPQKLINKQQVFQNITSMLQQLIVGQSEQQSSEENINLISQIEQNETMKDKTANQKKNRPGYSTKNNQQQHQNVLILDQIQHMKPIRSQNINIIQLSRKKQISGAKQRQETDEMDRKRPKQAIEAIKRKARQGMKDRELSHSRKMELSRSIQNATDILNKIQERSSRV